jgi:opacity protein-like surface antigen
LGEVTAGQSLGTANGLGPLGGFTLGANWQAPGTPWVFGIEGEFMFSDLKGTTSNSTSSVNYAIDCCGFLGTGENFWQNGTFGEQLSTNVRDIATIGARFGIASGPEDRTLWYVKGGGAWARTNWGESFTASGLECNQFFALGGLIGSGVDRAHSGTFNDTGTAGVNTDKWGWMVGTGVEWGLWQNWSAKIEYEFLDFGGQDLALNGTHAECPCRRADPRG